MTVDKIFCSSSYLMYRTIIDNEKCFSKKFIPSLFEENDDRRKVFSSIELEKELKTNVENVCRFGKVALALSGGIDSAILAKFMPKGSTCYTFKCIVPGVQVIDETIQAAKYAKECGLNHKIIPIYWEDFEKYTPILMERKGAPIHSIEVQIYKAALCAKADGIDTLIFGESADVNYGGLNGLLSKDYTVENFLYRYSYLMPDKVLKEYRILKQPIEKYSHNGVVDVHEFCRHVFYCESIGSYFNACMCANINFYAPFSKTYMGEKLDLERVRKGENKYWVREIFSRLYPGWDIPQKTPMPRPMNEWFSNWTGPKREEFIEDLDMKQFTGDQKWQMWCLEIFLDILDKDKCVMK